MERELAILFAFLLISSCIINYTIDLEGERVHEDVDSISLEVKCLPADTTRLYPIVFDAVVDEWDSTIIKLESDEQN